MNNANNKTLNLLQAVDLDSQIYVRDYPERKHFYECKIKELVARIEGDVEHIAEIMVEEQRANDILLWKAKLSKGQRALDEWATAVIALEHIGKALSKIKPYD